MPETYIVEVTVRMAITAEDEAHALDCAQQEFGMNAGALSDMLIYEWTDPVLKGVEEKPNV